MNLKNKSIKLNIKNNRNTKNTKKAPSVGTQDSMIDNPAFKESLLKNTKYAILNESGTSDVNDAAMKAFSNMGIVVNDSKGDDPFAHKNVIDRVNLYLKRFPEVEYIVDMITSSIIYSSSSNTKKIQCTLRGEYKSLKSTNADNTSLDSTENVDINVDINDIKVKKVDSWYDDLNLQIGNLFKKNNIKLALYDFIKSMLNYGCSIFYINDTINYNDVSFYSLDELDFSIEKKPVNTNSIFNELDSEDSKVFEVSELNNEIKKFNSNLVTVKLKEDGSELNISKMYFISDKGIFGKSKIMKIIHYLKTIELLELSLLIERLSKTKTTHVWKLDLEQVEEEDLSSTLMLYRNLLKSKVALNYDEDSDNMQFDFIKNLVDNNILVPTEKDNLKIDTLKSEFKPLLDDINYYWDKVYLSLGLPSYYRNTDTKTYTNSNMLIMHDNVYSMKIRHYQLIINNLLTFWIENQIKANFEKITVKYLNVNIPEFIPLSERKETDLEKSSKFINTFSQLESTLNIKLKKEFILNKLFPNDIISDMINIEETDKNDIDSNDSEKNERDEIMSLFEEKSKNESVKIFNITKLDNYDIVKCDLNLRIDW